MTHLLVDWTYYGKTSRYVRSLVRRILTAAVAAIFLAVPMLAAPQAQADTTPTCANEGGMNAGAPLCDENGNGLALWDLDGRVAVGNPIVMATSSATALGQRIGVGILVDPPCGNPTESTVEYDPAANTYCPFANHAWDNNYKGDPIEDLTFPNVGTGTECVGLDSTIDAILQNCSASKPGGGDGGKEWWVGAKTANGSNPYFVNVWATNYVSGSSVEALTGDTNGLDAYAYAWNGGTLQLWRKG